MAFDGGVKAWTGVWATYTVRLFDHEVIWCQIKSIEHSVFYRQEKTSSIVIYMVVYRKASIIIYFWDEKKLQAYFISQNIKYTYIYLYLLLYRKALRASNMAYLDVLSGKKVSDILHLSSSSILYFNGNKDKWKEMKRHCSNVFIPAMMVCLGHDQDSLDTTNLTFILVANTDIHINTALIKVSTLPTPHNTLSLTFGVSLGKTKSRANSKWPGWKGHL